MSEEYVFPAERSKWRQVLYYFFFNSSFISIIFVLIFTNALRYLHKPLPESSSLNLATFGLIFALVMGPLYMVDWWSGRVIVSGTVLKFRSWLHWRTINLNHLQHIELTQNSQGETVAIVLNRGKQEIDVNLCYLQDTKMLTDLLIPHVTTPTIKPLSNNDFYIYLGSSLLLFSLSFLYALDIAFVLLVGTLILWGSYKLFHLPLVIQGFGGLLGGMAMLCGVYALFQHGPAGHPCGYIGQAFQQTHCIRSWAEHDFVGFTTDSQQLIVGYKGYFQQEPIQTWFPQFQRTYPSARVLDIDYQYYSALITSSKWRIDNYILTYLQSGEWVFIDNNLYAPGASEPTAVLPPADAAAFAKQTQILALLNEENFLIYQLPQIELIAQIPLPAELAAPNPEQSCLAFAPHQPWLIYYHPQKGGVVIDVTTQTTLDQFTTTAETKTCFVAFLPGSNQLLTLENDVLRWRTMGQTSYNRELTLFTNPNRLLLSPNGRWLALQDSEESYLLDLR